MADELEGGTIFPESQNVLMAVPATGVRYLTPVFTDWTTEEGVYKDGLKYKVYMPANDTEDKRPVVFVFSGGGTIDINDVSSTCIEFVKLGYVSVAAQYKDYIGDFKQDAQVKQAVINSYWLIQFIRDSAVRFGVKKKKMFGVGTSAGAITWICAGITANDTTNPYYAGESLPNLKGCLIATASMSGAANPPYLDLIQSSTVQNNFFNGQLDPLIPYKKAQATYDKEIAFGIPSQIKIYPNSDHTLGEHDDIFYNPVYGIVPTFYNKLNVKPPKP